MKILKGIKAKKADVVEISCVIRKVKHDVYGKRLSLVVCTVE